MAKDSKGHGSERRGVSGVQARNDRMSAMFERARAEGHSTFNANADAQAAGVLAQGNPKSAQVPVHSGTSGPSYSREAVNAAIGSSNRAGRRIGGKEAKMIHALLKGRH